MRAILRLLQNHLWLNKWKRNEKKWKIFEQSVLQSSKSNWQTSRQTINMYRDQNKKSRKFRKKREIFGVIFQKPKNLFFLRFWPLWHPNNDFFRVQDRFRDFVTLWKSLHHNSFFCGYFNSWPMECFPKNMVKNRIFHIVRIQNHKLTV